MKIVYAWCVSQLQDSHAKEADASLLIMCKMFLEQVNYSVYIVPRIMVKFPVNLFV